MGITKRSLSDPRVRAMFFWETPEMAKKKAAVRAAEETAPPPLEETRNNSKIITLPAGKLWLQDIPVIGGAGEFGSGKTLFGLAIAPGPRTKVQDFEKSAAPYRSIGFDYYDVPDLMSKKLSKGYRPIDTFKWWRDDLYATPTGKYDVLHIDTASEVEEGLVEYVRANPEEFGYSQKQLDRGEGLVWAAVKSYWTRLLADAASRFQTLYFTVQMKQRWVGGVPTRERIPMGKSTLMKLSSLFLQFERTKDHAEPSAIVVKSRLSSISSGEGGLRIVPTLPPRMPVATPASIRAYMASPPDYAKLKDAEKITEAKATEEEILQLRLEAATTEERTEQMRLDRMTRFGKQAAVKGAATVKQANEIANTESNSDEVEAAKAAPAEDDESSRELEELDETLARNSRLNRVRELYLLLDIDDQQWAGILAKRAVEKVEDLTNEQLDELSERLSAIAAKRKEAQPATTPK